MNTQRLDLQVSMPFDYVEAGASLQEAKELVVFLHGYSQKGHTLIRDLAGACPATSRLLAPNGLFPIPRKTDKGFRVGYSWYFHDTARDEYLIDMTPSVQAVSLAIEALGLGSIPKRIVGFSQGGYLAPFVAQALKNVRQVVGISAGYLVNELSQELGKGLDPKLSPRLNFRWDGIHGDQDDVVGCEGAQRDHSSLKNLGIAGEFHVLKGVGHELTAGVVETLKTLLSFS